MPNLYKKPFIIANWKMNHGFESTDIWLDKFFRAFYSNREKFDNLTFVICPSTILLDYIDSEVMDEGLEQLEYIIAKRKQTLSRLTDEEIEQIENDLKLEQPFMTQDQSFQMMTQQQQPEQESEIPQDTGEQ